jgi:nicotinate phosphoribosyltransferase
MACTILDGDDARAALGRPAGRGAAERDAFYASLAHLAALLARQGLVVVVAATANRAVYRDQARAIAPNYVEVHVATSLAECERRDPKGLYAAARAGAATDVPGIDAAYEPPAAPGVIATGGEDVAAVDRVLVLLHGEGRSRASRTARAAWVDRSDVGLLTDLYELTMIDSYLAEGLESEAVFSLFARRLPRRRNYLVACGLEDVLFLLGSLRFSDDALAYLASLGLFSDRLLAWLRAFRFSGDVHAVPEGTPVFAGEPLVEIVAPLPQAQLVETLVMNQVHMQTVAASKAARVVAAAAGRTVVDFGLRRMPGADAGIKIARAAYVAGIDSTSNVLAGHLYGMPIAGTMAHSYVQVHATQLESFRAFARVHPRTVLLVDTYDTLAGVRDVVALARELGHAFQVRAVRLDSGDLLELSRAARRILDDAGLDSVEIFASGGLDEDAIARLMREGAPITGFGVGTAMGVSDDAPSLDMAYKLVSYAGRGRIKLSPGKALLPGQKQVFRREDDGRATGDVIAVHGESQPGRPLLACVMKAGSRASPLPTLDTIRAIARDERSRLPERIVALEPAEPGYPVEVSPKLAAWRDSIAAEHRRRE